MIDIGQNTLLLAASTIGLSEFPEDVALPALIQTYIAIPGYAHTRIKIISDWSEEDIPLSAQFKTIPPLYEAWKYLHLHAKEELDAPFDTHTYSYVSSFSNYATLLDAFIQHNHRGEPVYNLIVVSPDDNAYEWLKEMRMDQLYKMEKLRVKEAIEYAIESGLPRSLSDRIPVVESSKYSHIDRVNSLADIIYYLTETKVQKAC